MAASSNGHKVIVRMLLEKRAGFRAEGDHGKALTVAASSKGNGEIVRLLLDKGTNVHAEGGHYGYALTAASYGGHETVVQQLLEKAADVNAKGGPRLRAGGGSVRGTRKLLLKKGADVRMTESIVNSSGT